MRYMSCRILSWIKRVPDEELGAGLWLLKIVRELFEVSIMEKSLHLVYAEKDLALVWRRCKSDMNYVFSLFVIIAIELEKVEKEICWGPF